MHEYPTINGITAGTRVRRGKRGPYPGTVTDLFVMRAGPHAGEWFAEVKWHGSGVRRGNQSGGDRHTCVRLANLVIETA